MNCKLEVKPGKGYLTIAYMFFAFAIIIFLVTLRLEPSDDPVLTRLMLAALCVLIALPGLILVLIFKNVKMLFDDSGVVSSTIFGSDKRYTWDEITEARVKRGDGDYPCILYSRGKWVGKAKLSYDGYIQLIDLLVERRLMRENDVTRKAKLKAALRQVTFKELFAKRNDHR